MLIAGPVAAVAEVVGELVDVARPGLLVGGIVIVGVLVVEFAGVDEVIGPTLLGGTVIDAAGEVDVASGSGRIWKCTALGGLPGPVSLNQGALSPQVDQTPRPFPRHSGRQFAHQALWHRILADKAHAM